MWIGNKNQKKNICTRNNKFNTQLRIDPDYIFYYMHWWAFIIVIFETKKCGDKYSNCDNCDNVINMIVILLEVRNDRGETPHT